MCILIQFIICKMYRVWTLLLVLYNVAGCIFTPACYKILILFYGVTCCCSESVLTFVVKSSWMKLKYIHVNCTWDHNKQTIIKHVKSIEIISSGHLPVCITVLSLGIKIVLCGISDHNFYSQGLNLHFLQNSLSLPVSFQVAL